MSLEEIKEFVSYARKAGIKSLSFNGLSFELMDHRPVAKRVRKNPDDPRGQSITPDITLEQINNYIYSDEE